MNTTIPILVENENQRRYLVQTSQEYAMWLSTFERMLTKSERYGIRSNQQRKCEQHFNKMIRSLKHSMKTNKKCYIVENESHLYCRFDVISC